MRTDQVEEEVVEHGGDAVDDDGLREDGRDVPGERLQAVDRVVAHQVVEAGEHAQVVVVHLCLLARRRRQRRPRVTLSLLLLDLSHVL